MYFLYILCYFIILLNYIYVSHLNEFNVQLLLFTSAKIVREFADDRNAYNLISKGYDGTHVSRESTAHVAHASPMPNTKRKKKNRIATKKYNDAGEGCETGYSAVPDASRSSYAQLKNLFSSRLLKLYIYISN